MLHPEDRESQVSFVSPQSLALPSPQQSTFSEGPSDPLSEKGTANWARQGDGAASKREGRAKCLLCLGHLGQNQKHISLSRPFECTIMPYLAHFAVPFRVPEGDC